MRLRRLALTAALLATPVYADTTDRATTTHRFDDVAKWIQVFDDPKRDDWQRPAEVVQALGLRPGDAVADLGAGTGYFLPHLARAVGEQGTVYAVDLEPNLLAHIVQRAEKQGLANVTPILASSDQPRLARGSVDVLLVVDTFHHIDRRIAYFERLRPVLKPGGRVVVVDWKKEPLPIGPSPAHKLEPSMVSSDMTRAGYTLTGELKTLPYQYILIFAPK